jgi:hypothetical protein
MQVSDSASLCQCKYLKLFRTASVTKDLAATTKSFFLISGHSTLCSFMGAFDKTMAESGLENTFIASGLHKSCSMDQVRPIKHTSAMHVHQQMLKSLQ